MNKESLIKYLNELESIIFDNSMEFEKKYCYNGELINMYFGSSSFKFYYIDEDGQHLTDFISMDELFEWVNNIK